MLVSSVTVRWHWSWPSVGIPTPRVTLWRPVRSLSVPSTRRPGSPTQRPFAPSTVVLAHHRLSLGPCQLALGPSWHPYQNPHVSCAYLTTVVYVCAYVCMYACVCMYVCVCMCVCMYVFVYLCMCTRVAQKTKSWKCMAPQGCPCYT